jgi:hypothetical protein
MLITRIAAPLTAVARSTPCARCSSRRARPAEPVAARHRGRAGPDGRPPARRVAPDAEDDASPGSASRGPRRAPRRSASPAAARPTSAGPDGRVCAGSGWRSRGDRSDRSAARSSWASRRSRCGARSPDRRRPGSEASTAQAASSSGARWWRQERSLRSQAVDGATGSFRSSYARRISPTTSGRSSSDGRAGPSCCTWRSRLARGRTGAPTVARGVLTRTVPGRGLTKSGKLVCAKPWLGARSSVARRPRDRTGLPPAGAWRWSARHRGGSCRSNTRARGQPASRPGSRARGSRRCRLDSFLAGIQSLGDFVASAVIGVY